MMTRNKIFLIAVLVVAFTIVVFGVVYVSPLNSDAFDSESVIISPSTWNRLLSLPRDDARNELQQMFDKNQKLFMDVKIVGIKDTYTIGEPLEFKIVEAGYGNPCTHPHTIISQEGKELPHWEYRFVHSCPFSKDHYPILNYMQVPHNNRKVAPITEAGQYTITSYSRYDATDSKQFTVLPSDFIYEYVLTYTKHGNSTGNTTLEINLNNGSFIVTKNSNTIQNVLPENDLANLVQLIDDTDILRGASNMHYEHQESCRDCINHHIMISLGDYTHYVKWQNNEPDMNEKYISIVDKVNEILMQKGDIKN